MLARYVHSCGPDTTSALHKTQLYHTRIAGKQFFAETEEIAGTGKDSAEDSDRTNTTTTTTTTTATTAPTTATTTTTTAATATTSNTSSTSKTSSDNALGEGGGEGDGINFF